MKQISAPTKPYVFHLEQVCRLIENGAVFVAIEFNPHGKALRNGNNMIHKASLRIKDGGEMSIELIDGTIVPLLGVRLADYRRLWRVWSGLPTDRERMAMKWR